MTTQATNKLNIKLLEQMELIAVDTRKAFAYNKSTGLWAWYDRNDTQYHNGFATRFAALVDAVEPYLS